MSEIFGNVAFCSVFSALQNALRRNIISHIFPYSLNAYIMISSIIQHKVSIWKAYFFHDLDDENVSVIFSFLWAFQWYDFHPNKTCLIKRTKTVPELFSARNFIFDTVL